MLSTLVHHPRRTVIWLALAVASISIGGVSHQAAAARTVSTQGGGGNRNVARTSVHNQNVNVNRNVNIDTHGGYGHYDHWGHPIATAAAVTATAIAVGTMVSALPTGCAAAGPYQHCGNTYYQPMYQGSTVQYVVVSPP